MKQTDVWQSSGVSTMKKRVIVVLEYLVIAILAGGTFFVVSLFTIFAPASPANKPATHNARPQVVGSETFDRIPSTVATRAITTSNPWGIAIDSSRGTVWVAEPGCEPKPTCPTTSPGVIGEYNLLDGSFFQDFPEPRGYTNPVFVAVDANGNVWFTQPNSDAIGELNPQNATWSQWNVLKGSMPYDLTFDKNGNLWFTEFGANRIGFFNPQTHKLVENTIPTPDSNPYGITRDPQGNIWFTENKLGVGQIGSFTPTTSGTVTIVEHAVATAQPHLITTDKAGNIWYSEAFGASIGVFSPGSGTSRNYAVSTIVCTHTTVCLTHISGISVDKRGNIWFDDSLSGRVGYLVPATGQVIARTLGKNHAYDGLAVDNYNNVWFTETFGSVLVMWPSGSIK
jgi:streptogramin lyase